VVLVDPGYLAAHPLGDLAQFALLVGRRLVDGRYPKIENRTPHLALPLEISGRGIARGVSNINLF
jgi:hypothetical protein